MAVEGGCLVELAVFATIGVILAVAGWIWEMVKRAITGTPLSKDEEQELKDFKKDQTENKPT